MDSRAVKAFTFDETAKKLRILDQTKLPQSIEYVDVPDTRSGHSVIKTMQVRGAPCIAAVGCLSLVAELNHSKVVADPATTVDKLTELIREKSNYLITSRPTAVNLRSALDKIGKHLEDGKADCSSPLELVAKLTDFCARAIDGGLAMNQRLGEYGAREIMRTSKKTSNLKVLTHCNTGSLATVGYGTALGVIRSLHKLGALDRAYCTETRPYNQGSRLTAWELVAEEIPATLIADSMVAYLMASREINAVVVGADCVAANGDTANKIGTLQIALTAKHYKVPFYVAAPTQSIDVSISSQAGIEIEQRPADELRKLAGIDLAPANVEVWNPCFDVTPAELIAGVITERGFCATKKIREFMLACKLIAAQDTMYALF